MRVKHAKDGGEGNVIRSDGRIALVRWDCLSAPLLCYVTDLRRMH